MARIKLSGVSYWLFVIEADTVLLIDNKEVWWNVKTDFKLIAGYDKPPDLIGKFILQTIFKETVERHLTTLIKQGVPQTFSFSFNENQIAQLQEIGLNPRGEITGKNRKIVYKKEKEK